MAVDPSVAIKSYFHAQGVAADLNRDQIRLQPADDCDAYAVESHKRAAASWAAAPSRSP